MRTILFTAAIIAATAGTAAADCNAEIEKTKSDWGGAQACAWQQAEFYGKRNWQSRAHNGGGDVNASSFA